MGNFNLFKFDLSTELIAFIYEFLFLCEHLNISGTAFFILMGSFLQFSLKGFEFIFEIFSDFVGGFFLLLNNIVLADFLLWFDLLQSYVFLLEIFQINV